MTVRANWRDIPVVDLTDDEVAMMSDMDQRYCHDLLYARHVKATAAPGEKSAVEAPIPIDIDAAEFAILAYGRRIRIYPGEGFDPGTFAGELLNPTEREMRGQGHISCLWDRAKVVTVEGTRA